MIFQILHQSINELETIWTTIYAFLSPFEPEYCFPTVSILSSLILKLLFLESKLCLVLIVVATILLLAFSLLQIVSAFIINLVHPVSNLFFKKRNSNLDKLHACMVEVVVEDFYPPLNYLNLSSIIQIQSSAATQFI